MYKSVGLSVGNYQWDFQLAVVMIVQQWKAIEFGYSRACLHMRVARSPPQSAVKCILACCPHRPHLVECTQRKTSEGRARRHPGSYLIIHNTVPTSPTTILPQICPILAITVSTPERSHNSGFGRKDCTSPDAVLTANRDIESCMGIGLR
ncbi:hypothetical protein G7K_4675-t1 [Saitoella complicata NRRL Y-17804]|uniref:Uncharacterized protein n=1 Tax=Saitoella complicata (strain BCRC 22490 / CBS 7301 / JCM 7358 / NBRC 10748 / NRRL Y-17804) TaxID=698492 RepID=A0A0E9NLJ7_SAICN|nr:hypothetical protein G7K_4675-t1 [Saitoella complicata NRRL Y-17804]